MSSEILLSGCALVLLLGGQAPPVPTPSPARAPGKVFLTVEEALELAFPECEVQRETAYLKAEHKKRIAKLAKTDFDDGIVHPYVATKKGRLVGTAYFDVHRVRTLRETVMFVVGPKGELLRVELLAFGEPPEYIPRPKWYGQLLQRKLDDELQLGRGIRKVTGATLTARATTNAARRSLALHQVLGEIAAEKERKKKKKKKGKGGSTGDEPRERDASSPGGSGTVRAGDEPRAPRWSRR